MPKVAELKDQAPALTLNQAHRKCQLQAEYIRLSAVNLNCTKLKFGIGLLIERCSHGNLCISSIEFRWIYGNYGEG
jgi:hypothetical protein